MQSSANTVGSLALRIVSRLLILSVSAITFSSQTQNPILLHQYHRFPPSPILGRTRPNQTSHSRLCKRIQSYEFRPQMAERRCILGIAVVYL